MSAAAITELAAAGVVFAAAADLAAADLATAAAQEQPISPPFFLSAAVVAVAAAADIAANAADLAAAVLAVAAVVPTVTAASRQSRQQLELLPTSERESEGERERGGRT